MGLMDKIKGMLPGGGGSDAAGGVMDKAKNIPGADKIGDVVDKATDKVDDMTGGKFTEQLDKVDDAVDKITGGDDDEAAAE